MAMSNIREALAQVGGIDQKIGEILIEFYETMKRLESDPHRGGKQATKTVMAISDIKEVFEKQCRVALTLDENAPRPQPKA